MYEILEYVNYSAILQSEMKSSKSSVWAGVEGSVASDLVSTLSFILNTQPRVIAGKECVWYTMLAINTGSGRDT